MRRQSRIAASLLVLACATSGASANRKFNIHDDLLAYPQFRLQFPDEYILDSQAQAFLEQTPHGGSSTADKRDTEQQAPLKDENADSIDEASEDEDELSYEELALGDRRYLCSIPVVHDGENNVIKEEVDVDEEKKELARATDRGLELLREMEGKCLYYVSGWWSYSFCYMNQIKQFHALPAGPGIPSYPPMEDHTTLSFILGRFPHEDGQEKGESDAKPEKPTTDLAELQTRGGSRYLVQHLDTGDVCDLTGQNRKIEVQFHCNPQSTDRIAWIKELSICSYLMLIYTPRLCNDVAFQPPQQEEVHTIECREILTPDEVPSWQSMHEYYLSQKLVESAETPEYPIIGGIEVGAQRLVGTEGKVIEKGRVASIGEEKVDVVAKRVNGEVQLISADDLKKFDLDPKKIEELKKKLEEYAKGKDWTLEIVTGHGQPSLLRGMVDDEKEGKEGGEKVVDKEQKKDTKGIEEKPTGQGEKVQISGQLKEEDEPEEKEGKEPTVEEGDPEGSEEVFKDEL
ncbi:PRKCSH domain-containing protein [Aspergillus undulatus]|uniref:PRKCSH domain-containing protein n=1 Tax=Aspergillus undulatus TaxID=1810928 RepID=UPI003CCCEB51